MEEDYYEAFKLIHKLSPEEYERFVAKFLIEIESINKKERLLKKPIWNGFELSDYYKLRGHKKE